MVRHEVRFRGGRPLASAFAAAALLAAAVPSFALGRCDKCPWPDVLMFDFDMKVPRPPSGVWNKEASDFLAMHFADDVAGDVVFNGGQDCVHFRDGDMVVTGIVRVSTNTAFPPPPGKIDTGDDYLFTGEVAREGDGYRVTMYLETACSRQRVHSASGTFTIPAEITIDTESELGKKYVEDYLAWELVIRDSDEWVDPPDLPQELVPPHWSAALERLTREAFVPLLPKIREFERRLRKTDRRYAISLQEDDSIRVVPARRHVKPFERVPVEITLADCDGEPLPGREVLLDPGGGTWFAPSENGRFEEPRVTTDEAGKATATFVVGAKRGVAIASVGVVHLLPSGCESGWGESAVLDVDATAALYEVRFDYEWSQEVARDVTEPLKGGSRTESYRDSTKRRMACTGVWENPPEAQQDGYIELSGAPVAGCRVDGEYRGLEAGSDRAYVFTPSGGPGLSDSRYTRTGHMRRMTTGRPVHPGDEPVDLFFWYKGGAELDSSQFDIQVPFDLRGEVESGGLEVVSAGGVVVRTPTSDRQSEEERSTFGAGVSEITYTEERASVVVAGTSESEETEGATTTRRSARLRAVITPVASLGDAAPRR